MKKPACITALFLFLAAIWPLYASALGRDDLISASACLMDAETGQVLFDKNMDAMMYPASTTKVMTGLLVAELSDPGDIATVSESAIDIAEWNSSNIALSPGEELPVDSLMYALMLPSANDAANTLAEHIAGSQSDFAALMNDRARKIGANSTNFVNAHGLHEPQHYTTARDMALITREAAKNPVFMHYFGTATHTIPPTNLQPEERPFTNYQYMLNSTTRFYDPDVIGGKVGYTTEAGHTMTTVARRDGRTLVCVVMNSPNRYDKFRDTLALLEFGFEEFSEVTISRREFPEFVAGIEGDETAPAEFLSGSDFTALLHNSVRPEDIKIEFSHPQPFAQGEALAASAVFTAEADNPAVPSRLGEIKLTAARVPAAITAATIHMVNEFSIDDLSAGKWNVAVYILAGVGAAASGLIMWRQVKLQKRRKRRRERMERLRREFSG